MKYGNHLFCVIDNRKYIANEWACYNCKLSIIDTKDKHWAWYVGSEEILRDIVLFCIKTLPLTCEEVIMHSALD